VSGPTTDVLDLALSWTAQLDDAVSALVWSPDGAELAAGSLGGDAVVLAADGTSRHQMDPHHDGVLALAWSAGGRWLAIGGQSSAACIWSPGAGSTPIPVRGWVNDLAWAPRSDRLAVAAGSDVVVVRPDASVIADYPFLEGTVNALVWSGGGRHLVVGTLGAVHWFDPVVAGRRAVRTAKVVGASLSLATSPDTALVAGGQLNGNLAVWDEVTGRGPVLTSYDGGVERLSWRHDGRLLAVAAYGELDVWMLDARGKAAGAPISLAETEATLGGLAFHPTGPLLAGGGRDGWLQVWEPGAAAGPPAMLEVGEEITTLAWLPGTEALALGTSSGAVHLVTLG